MAKSKTKRKPRREPMRRTVNRRAARKLARELWSAFTWSETDQGHWFWRMVVQQLENLAGGYGWK